MMPFNFQDTNNKNVKNNAWADDERDIHLKYRRQSLMKSIQRKNVEARVNKYFQLEEKKHLEALKQHHHHVTTTLKNYTIWLFLKISGTLVQSLLSIFACIVYVVNTYMDKDQEDLFSIFEIVIASLFSVDYLWSFLQANDKKKFFFNLMNMMDLLTILPVFISFIGEGKAKGTLKFTRILRAIRVFRILRLYRLFRNAGRDQEEINVFLDYSDIKKKGLMICTTLLSMLFIAAGIFHSLQEIDFLDFRVAMPDPSQKMSFDASFYFMLTTITTIGFGDIKPVTVSARVFVATFMFIFIILINKELSDLYELLKYNSQYRTAYHGEHFKHVILTGNITKISLIKFVKEFFHSEHQVKNKLKVVIVQPYPPSSEILGVMTNPKYEDLLQYIVGNIFKENVMKMAGLHFSKSVFILSNQYQTATSQKDDTFAILASKAIHEYSPKTTIYVQLISPHSLLHSWADWDCCMSTQAIKMGILVNNALYPGFSTWISNMIASSRNFMKREMEALKWVMEYSHGVGQELYIVLLPEKLENMAFMDAMQSMYKMNGVLLFGVKSLVKEDINFYDIYINPVNYRIRKGDFGLFLAPTQKKAENFEEIETVFMNIYEHIDPSNEKILNTLEINSIKKESVGTLTKDYYKMSEDDMRGLVWNHLIVFGRVENISELFESYSHLSNQYICFVTDEKPSEKWQRVRIKYPKGIYIECNLTSIDELSRTAINFASHAILLTWDDHLSNIADSGILPLARLIEENFTTPYTLELRDESNMRYLKNLPNIIWSSISYNIWPKYASSQVFFSSILENILPQEYYNPSFIDVISKIATCDRFYYQRADIDENNHINTINIPDELANRCKYIQLFLNLTRRPRPVIPLGILRTSYAFDNEFKVFVTNPDPEAPFLKGDTVLVFGNLIKDNEIKKFSIDMDINIEKNIRPANKKLIEQAKKYLNEEENLEFDDSDLLERIQEELNTNKNEREGLKKQNETIRNLLMEYEMVERALTDQYEKTKEKEKLNHQQWVETDGIKFDLNMAKKNSIVDLSLGVKPKKKLKKSTH